ncbi:Protein VMS1 [Yarrowia sp. C11]|nr:Protein VMS1 [Yarrowia sp. C11]
MAKKQTQPTAYFLYNLPETILKSLKVYDFNGVLKSEENENKPSSQFSPDEKAFHRYNHKLRLQGLAAIRKPEYDQLLKDGLIETQKEDESDSNSNSEEDTESDSDEEFGLPRKMELASISEDGDIASKDELKGSPVIFLKSPEIEPKTLTVYKNALGHVTATEASILAEIQRVNTLPEATSVIIMAGGGHFAAAIFQHSPKIKNTMVPLILETKSFHRYTTRRSQGGSQSASDGSKGKAKSVGSSLRRYGESQLQMEVKELLTSPEWKKRLLPGLPTSAANIYIRASGKGSRGLVLGFEGCPIPKNDPRVKSIPFNTRRANYTEVLRSWTELSTVKVVDVSKEEEEAEKAREKEVEKARKEQSRLAAAEAKKQQQEQSKKHISVALTPLMRQTAEITELIRKSRAPKLISYLKLQKIKSPYELEFPEGDKTASLCPTALHYAAKEGSAYIVSVLLKQLGADPTATNSFGKTAWDLASDTKTRDAFQLARGALGEEKWDWKASHVDEPLTEEQIEERNKKEAAEHNQQVKQSIAEQEEEQKEKESTKRFEKIVAKSGLGKRLPQMATQLEDTRGLSDEAKMRLERERRARAAEARFAKN